MARGPQVVDTQLWMDLEATGCRGRRIIRGFGQGIGGVDFQEGAPVLLAVLAAVLILIPLLFFGIELIILGALLAAGVIGRVMFRQPWVIEARPNDPLTPGRRLEWHVVGWRESHALMENVISDLAAGREPLQGALPR